MRTHAAARPGSGSARQQEPGDAAGGARSAASPADGLPGISGLVSRYALGVDYHIVVKRRLEELARFLRAEGGGRVEARCLLDTSAILERDHAAEAGNGWTGKNAMVIDPQAGSWFFLGEILTDLALAPEPGIEDQCGSCTRCVDACPTGAIVEPRFVDSRRCISYLTIELRGAIPAPLRGAVGENLFGCDICQEVCPWNRLAPPPADGALGPGPALTELDLAAAVSLDEAAFAARFRRSPIARARRAGFARNALIVAANRGNAAALQAGESLLTDPDPAVRETAVWALARGEAPQRRAAALAAEREPDPVLRRRMAGEETGRGVTLTRRTPGERVGFW